MRARYDVDPRNHGWELEAISINHAVFTRTMRASGTEVTLCYYYTTGTVHLVYPRERYPGYIDDKPDYKVVYDPDECRDVQVDKLVQETFRGLDDAEFAKAGGQPPYLV